MADIQSNIDVNIDTTNAVANLRSLQRQVSAFYTSLSSAGAAANGAVANMQQNLINSINATGKFSAELSRVQSTAQSFTTALEKNKLSLGQYFKFAAGASKNFGNLFKTEQDVINRTARERVKDLQTQYIKLGKNASGAIETIKIRPLSLDMSNLATQTAMAAQKQQLLNQLLRQGSTHLLNFGKNTQWAGRQLMVGFSIPLSMVGTSAAKTFMEMEKQAISFKRVYGDAFTATAETNQVLSNIRSLATEFTKYGVAAEKTMELAAKAAAAGQMGADLIAQVREANRLAVLGQVEQTQALETTMSVTNAFGIAAADLTEKINFLNAVENQTVTSIEDLTIAIPKAGPVVKQLGGSVEDLAFFLTAMKEGGINASEGANALKSGLASMINPTEKASQFLKGFGINLKGIVDANEGDVKGIIVDFATALNELDPTNRARVIEQLFGKFQFSRLSTLFQNVVKDGTQASRVLELSGKSASELAALASKELGSIAASAMFKFQKSVEDLRIQLAPLGETFLKIATPIVDGVAKILQGFNSLDEKARTFIIGLIAVVGGLGPVLLMTFGLIANGVANIIKGFTLVRNLFNRTGDSTTFLGEQTDYMTQQQLEAAAAASSLEQIHQKLEQRFTSETKAIDKLTQALGRAVTAQNAYRGTGAPVRGAKRQGFASGGMVRGPGGPKGDAIPANLSDGEAVIDAETVKKNPAIIAALFDGKKIKIPGYAKNNKKTINISGAKSKTDTDLENLSAQELWKTAIEASHASPTFAQDSAQFREVELKMGALPPEYKQFMSAVSNLVIDLPKSLNQAMKNEKKGVGSDKFLEVWKARTKDSGEGKLTETRGFGGSAFLGGLEDTDKEGRQAVETLTDEIGIRTKQIADETNNGKVTDRELAKATREVIDARKKEAGAIGRAAKALDAASKQVGQGRITLNTQAMREGLESGKIKKVRKAGRRDEQLFITGQDGRDIPVGILPGEGSSNAGGLRSTDPYNPSGGYRKVQQKKNRVLAARELETSGEQIVAGVAKGINKASRSNSPSRRAIDASSKNLVDGVLAPVINSKPKATKAGDSFVRSVGEAVPSAANTKFLTRKVQQLVSRALAAYNVGGAAVAAGVQSPIVVSRAPKEKPATPTPRVIPVPVPVSDDKPTRSRRGKKAKDTDENTKELTTNTSRLTVINNRLQQMSFALMSVSGLFSVFGSGPLAEFSNVIAMATGGFYALSTILEMLNGINLVALAQKRLEIGMNAGKAATSGINTAIDAAMTAALIKKGGPIGGKAGGIFSKFTGFISKIIPGLARFGAGIVGVVRGIAGFLGPWGQVIAGVLALGSVIAFFIGEEQKRQEQIKGFGEAVSVSTDKLNSWSDMLGLERRITPLDRLKAGIAPASGTTAVQDAATKFATDESFLSKDKGFGEQIEAFKTATKAQATAILSTVSSTLSASGATEDQVQAVILAIQAAAKNKKVKIEFKDINFATKEGRAGIKKNVGDLLAEFDKIANDPKNQKKVYSGGRMGGQMITQQSEELRTSTKAMADFFMGRLSDLQSMLETGKITAKEYAQSFTDIETALKNSANGGMIATVMMKQLGESIPDAAFSKAVTSVKGLGNQMFVWKAVMAGAITNANDLATALDNLKIASDTTGKYTPAQIAAAKAAIQAINDRIAKEQLALESSAKLGDQQQDTGTKEKSAYQEATESLKEKIKQLYNANTAYNKLKRAGVDSTTAVEIANDSMFAAAIAKTKVNSKEWKALIKLINEYKAAAKTGMPQTDENKMKGTVDKILDMLNNRKNVIELKFKVDTEALERDARIAQEQIDALQFSLDDYEAGLTRLEDKEDAVNKTYDKRIEALDKIEAANQRISDQKNAELNISQALARGDVGAAALAIQEEQQRQAQEAFTLKKESLEKQRQAELAGLTAEVMVDGKKTQMSRIDIENKVKDIKDQIFNIEENTLEPIRERIRLLEVEKNKKIDEINNFKGLSTAAWELIKGRIDDAETSSAKYLKDIEDGLALLREHKQLWEDIGNLGSPAPKPDPKKDDKKKDDKGKPDGGGQQQTSTTTGLSQSPTAVDRRAAGTPTQGQITSYKSVITQLKSQTAYLKTLNPYHKDWKGTSDVIARHKASISDFENKFGVQYRANGGMIMPNYLSFGGMAKGTDTVPAMLTPGEFVMSKYAVDSYGVDTMKAINSGQITGGSVYNSYEVNVNVRSDANPDQIARAVMGQIRQVNSQQLRGNRF